MAKPTKSKAQKIKLQHPPKPDFDLAKTTKSKALIIKPRHPPKVTFEVWRKAFETGIIGGTPASKALKKYRAYFAKTFAAQECTSDQELRTEMLCSIYAETGRRPFNAANQRDSTFFSEKLQEIVASLDAFTARVRQRKGGLIPSADGSTFVNPGKVVQVFEDALRVARNMKKVLQKPRG